MPNGIGHVNVNKKTIAKVVGISGGALLAAGAGYFFRGGATNDENSPENYGGAQSKLVADFDNALDMPFHPEYQQLLDDFLDATDNSGKPLPNAIVDFQGNSILFQRYELDGRAAVYATTVSDPNGDGIPDFEVNLDLLVRSTFEGVNRQGNVTQLIDSDNARSAIRPVNLGKDGSNSSGYMNVK